MGSHFIFSFFSVILDQQKKIFLPAPRGIRKCVVSTNIAATSLTIEGVRYWFLSLIKSCNWGDNSERSGFGKTHLFCCYCPFLGVCSKTTLDIIIVLEVTNISEPNLKSNLLNTQDLGGVNVFFMIKSVLPVEPSIFYLSELFFFQICGGQWLCEAAES